MGALDRIFRRRQEQQRPLESYVRGLFAAAEQGVWYDPAGHADVLNQLGPELIANASFDGGLTGWTVSQPAGSTISAAGGNLSFVTDGGTYSALSQSAAMIVGALYVVTLEGVSGTGSLKVVGIDTEVQFSASRSFIGRATSTTFAIARTSGVAAAMSIGRVSLKEWLGVSACTLFQDPAGATPAYLPGQGQADPPVGLMLDKRLGLVAGTELVTTPDVTGVAVGGPATTTYSTGAVVQAGRFYRVTFTVSGYAGSGDVGFGAASFGASARASANGVFSFTCQSAGLASATLFTRSTNTCSFSNVSVRELPGNHAYQATATSRPTLSARYNGLLASEKYNDGSYWTWKASFTSEITADTVAPDNTTTAWKITSTNANAALSKAGLTGFRNPVLTVWCKAGTWNPTIMVRNATTATNLIGGAITAPDRIDTYGKFTNTDMGNGWRRLRVEVTSGVATTDTIVVYVGSMGAIPVGQFMYIWRSDLREAGDGVGVPEYQRVVDASTYDTQGFPAYLRMDGVDDWLQTASVDFSGTDKATLWAAIRKLSDAAAAVVCELTTTSTNDGSFFIAAPTVANQPLYAFATRGSVGAITASISGYAAPHTAVLVASMDNMGSGFGTSAQIRTRINGVDGVKTSGTSPGNYANAALYIGRRAGTSLPFNGRLYGLIIRGAATPGATVARVERYLNAKARAY